MEPKTAVSENCHLVSPNEAVWAKIGGTYLEDGYVAYWGPRGGHPGGVGGRG